MTILEGLDLNGEQFDLLRVIMQFYKQNKLVTDSILTEKGVQNAQVLEDRGLITINNNGHYKNILPTELSIMLESENEDDFK